MNCIEKVCIFLHIITRYISVRLLRKFRNETWITLSARKPIEKLPLYYWCDESKTFQRAHLSLLVMMSSKEQTRKTKMYYFPILHNIFHICQWASKTSISLVIYLWSLSVHKIFCSIFAKKIEKSFTLNGFVHGLISMFQSKTFFPLVCKHFEQKILKYR